MSIWLVQTLSKTTITDLGKRLVPNVLAVFNVEAEEQQIVGSWPLKSNMFINLCSVWLFAV